MTTHSLVTSGSMVHGTALSRAIEQVRATLHPFAGVAEMWRTAARKRTTIAELSKLDDRLLRDIGIERGQIEEVANAIAEGADVDALINRGR
jgi:uncharacterized protein YjiS (DUF1127 family)